MATKRRPAYGRPAGAAEWRRLGEILSGTFGFPKGRFVPWTRSAGRGNLRVARAGGRVVGGLAKYPMGMWFGGRSVPCTGIAAVGVEPASRATGVASGMMRAVVGEIAAEGVALSALYPATQPVYRQAGYEQAGVRCHFSLVPKDVHARDREPEIRPAAAGDRAAIRRVYDRMARAGAGLLDRSPHLWRRALGNRTDSWERYVVGRGRAIDGYVVVRRDPENAAVHEMHLMDLAFATPEAGRRILSFLASHRSMVKGVQWCGGPQDPLLALLREPDFTLHRQWIWMVRVTDLRRALGGRGYPPGLAATVDLEVEDDLLEKNRGRWTLEVSGGRGRIRRGGRGGRGTVRLDASALAPLYTGFRSPHELRACAALDGPDSTLATLAAVFAGPTPWIREMF